MDTDGLPDGELDGLLEGFPDGMLEGSAEGEFEGWAEGEPDGSFDGEPDGSLDGFADGRCDGIPLGSCIDGLRLTLGLLVGTGVPASLQVKPPPPVPESFACEESKPFGLLGNSPSL